MSVEAEVWAALAAGFAELLRKQRTGRSLEEIVLYVADLTGPVGTALARALHAARLGPDPASMCGQLTNPFTVGLTTAEEMVAVIERIGPFFECAAAALRQAPAPSHVRVLFATEEVGAVLDLHVAALLPSATTGGVS